MIKMITKLEEENKIKERTFTNEDNDKIRMLEESLIRATLDKVSIYLSDKLKKSHILKFHICFSLFQNKKPPSQKYMFTGQI